MRLSPRTAVLAAAVALTVAAAPSAAVADDAAIKASIPAAFDALAKKEHAAAKAIVSFNKHRHATRAGRARVRAVRAAVRNFQTLLSAQQASTPQGEAAKQALLKALDLEATAATQRRPGDEVGQPLVREAHQPDHPPRQRDAAQGEQGRQGGGQADLGAVGATGSRRAHHVTNWPSGVSSHARSPSSKRRHWRARAPRAGKSVCSSTGTRSIAVIA